MEECPNNEDSPLAMECQEPKLEDIKTESDNINCDAATGILPMAHIEIPIGTIKLKEENSADEKILPDEVELISCPTCDESFNSLFSLNKHVLENHVFSCKMCTEIFQNELVFGQHLAIVHNIHYLKFSNRLINFWSKQKGNRSQGMPYPCPVCGCEAKGFASLALLEAHVSRCHREEHALESTDVTVLSLGAETLPEVSALEDSLVSWEPTVNNLVQPTEETQTKSINILKTCRENKQKCKTKDELNVELIKNQNSGYVVEERHTAKRSGRQKAVPRKRGTGEKGKFTQTDALEDIQLVLQKNTKISTLQRSKGIDSDPFMRCFLKEVDTNQDAIKVESNSESPISENPSEQSNLGAKHSGLGDGLNNINLLYIYPFVDYRTPSKEVTNDEKSIQEYLEPVDKTGSQKINLFYNQPIVKEPSSSEGSQTLVWTDSSQAGGSIPRKVLILSTVARDVSRIESFQDMEGSLSDSRFRDCDHCILCKQVFSNKAGLQNHMVSAHVDEKHNRCGICNCTFDSVFKARSHVMMEHVDVQCKCCQREFKKSSSLRNHLVSHSVGKLRGLKRCEVCFKNYPTATALADHVVSEHPSLLKHQCDLCEKTFLTEDELFIHVDKDPHLCLLCSMYFESTLTLREHLLGHASDLQVRQLFTSPEVSGS